MRLFSDSSFLAAARVEISEQFNECASKLQELAGSTQDANINNLDEHQENLLNEVLAGTHQIKTLFENANVMMGNIEHFLISGEFPSSQEMQNSVVHSGADVNALDLVDDYKALDDANKEKFAFVACNYELISTMLDNAIELCAVLHKATKKF